MNILLDMNMPRLWVQFLADAGHQTVHWSQVGDIRADDEQIMAWARANDHILLTHDLDFGALLYLTDAESPSVVQIRAEHVVPRSVGAAVLDALDTAAETIERGALVTIDPRRNRIRLLPLRQR